MSSSTRASPALSTTSTVANNARRVTKSWSVASDEPTTNEIAVLSQQMLVAQQNLTELQAEKIASLQAKLNVTELSQKIVAAQRSLTDLQAEEITSLKARLKEERNKKGFWMWAWEQDQELINKLLDMSKVKGHALKELKNELRVVRAQANAARENDQTDQGEVDHR